MTKAVLRSALEACQYADIPPCHLIGRTFASLLEQVEDEYPSATIYWNCWTEAELSQVFGA
jgi:hypothetical protein